MSSEDTRTSVSENAPMVDISGYLQGGYADYDLTLATCQFKSDKKNQIVSIPILIRHARHARTTRQKKS